MNDTHVHNSESMPPDGLADWLHKKKRALEDRVRTRLGDELPSPQGEHLAPSNTKGLVEPRLPKPHVARAIRLQRQRVRDRISADQEEQRVTELLNGVK